MTGLEEGLGPPLLVIALGILLLPGIARKVGIPTAAAEVVFGVALGVVGRALLEDRLGWQFELGIQIEFLALIGLLILMFLAGLEVDFDRLEQAGPTPIILGLSCYTFTLGLAWFGCQWLFPVDLLAEVGVNTLFLALILSATSVGIVLPVIKEAGLTSKALGQDLLIAAALADFAAIVGLTIYALYLGSGGSGAWGWLEMGFIPLLALVFYLCYRLANSMMWRYPLAVSRFFHGHDAPETGMRTSLALMLLFAGLASAMGQEALLGAFLAGLLLSLLFRKGEHLEEKLSAFGYGFFIPIFFIWTGFQFDLADVTGESGIEYQMAFVPLAIMLIILQLGSKIVGGLLLSSEHGMRQAAAGGTLLGANLAIAVAGTEVGIKAGALPDDLRSPVILMALLSALIAPVVFNRIMGLPIDEEAPEETETEPED